MASEVIQHLPLDQFDADQRVRARLNQDLVEQIAQSFRTVGQLQPVRARWEQGRLKLVDGHHRLAAALVAGLPSLTAIIEGKELCDGEVLQRQLIINCQREDLSPLEKARGIRGLMEVADWNANQAAAALGFSNATVTRLLKLLVLPEAIVAEVEAGKIPASAAYELAFINDPAKQAELAGQLADGRLTRDALSGARKAAARKPSVKAAGASSRVTAVLGAGRSVTVSSAELTLDRFIEVIEEVLGKARRVRTQGVELGTFVKMLHDQSRTP